jgi:hypothetical protein
MARPGSGHVRPLLHRGDTMNLPRLRIPPVVDPGPRTAREPTTATANATMAENAMETREGVVRGRFLHPLVVRVDVTNTMAIQRSREVDGTTGGIETGTRDMSIGKEIGGMGREKIPLTANTRGSSGLEHQMSAKTEDRTQLLALTPVRPSCIVALIVSWCTAFSCSTFILYTGSVNCLLNSRDSIAADPRRQPARHGCGCSDSVRSSKQRQTLSWDTSSLATWWMDSTPKGREPRFTLSSSNQLIVQARRAVFGGNLLLSTLLSDLTSPQVLFLLLDTVALGFAAAVLHLRYAPAPLYESDDVVTSVLLPVITAAVDGLWVAALCVFHLVSYHRSHF